MFDPEVRPLHSGKSDRLPAMRQRRFVEENTQLGATRQEIESISGAPDIDSIWDKPLVNMRASCATELAQSYPTYVVTAWLGHSQAIAEAHDWQVTEDHFQKAAQNPAQQTAVGGRNGQQGEFVEIAKRNNPQKVAGYCEIVRIGKYTQQESNLQPSVP